MNSSPMYSLHAVVLLAVYNNFIMITTAVDILIIVFLEPSTTGRVLKKKNKTSSY